MLNLDVYGMNLMEKLLDARQCFAYRPSVVHQLCLIQAKREVCERHEGRSQLFDDKRIDSKSLTTPFVDQG